MFFKKKSKIIRKTKNKPLHPIPFADVIKECHNIGLDAFPYPIAKVIYNSFNTKRAVILDRNGSFRITYEVLFAFADFELEYAECHGFWTPDGMSGFIDTVEHAERIISENIEFESERRL